MYNNLLKNNKKLMIEYNFDKNNNLNLDALTLGSDKKIWWICKNKHEWEASIGSRYRTGCGCPYCSNKKVLEGYNDLTTTNPSIAKEWDFKRNSLLPTEIQSGSNKKVWWICPKGHEYEASVVNRTKLNGTGCPICTKERVTSFQEKIVYYYIKKYFPDAKDNYKLKNYGKRELDIFIPSIKVAIEYDGGYYHTSTKSDIEKDKLCEMLGIKLYRIRDIKCSKINSTSICFYRKDKTDKDLEQIIFKILNDLNVQNIKVNIESDIGDIYSKLDFMEKEKSLSSIKPELLKEWNYNKNGKLTPESISPSSSKKVWWICPKGHEYEASILNRTKNNGTKCPVCCNQKVLKGYNNLETLNPNLAVEFDVNKNNGKTASDFVLNSGKKVWWKCKNCNFEWEATIVSRNHGYHKCPKCKN